MKHIYFVRHGESVDNAADVFSHTDAELTPRGEVQAQSIHTQCVDMPLDIIITSDYPRAIATGDFIKGDSDTPTEIVELFGEIKHPVELIGKAHTDSEAQAIVRKMHAHFDEPDWHYSDEENFSEFQQRLIDGLMHIIERTEDRILVVTHSYAMKMLMSIILGAELLSPDLYHHISHVLTTNNTGITYARYGSDHGWELVTWNNYTHLSHVLENNDAE